VTNLSSWTNTAAWPHKKRLHIRRILAEAENNQQTCAFARQPSDHLLSVPTDSWPEAADKARYVLSLYAAGLAPDDTHRRDLVAAVLADFARSQIEVEL
jgi:hypothetical protein